MPVIPQSYVRYQESGEGRWFLVHSKPARERLAASHLRRQGYELYFPEVLNRFRQRDRWAERVTPLFPRYLFLRVESGRQCLAPVRSTQGVASVVRFGVEYAEVPAQVVDGLRARADACTGLHRLAQTPPLTCGARIRIVAGALDGLDGVFLRESGDERVIVLLDLLAPGASVRVPAGCVRPLAVARTG
jgi:transcriptional antiterminator RfaH